MHTILHHWFISGYIGVGLLTFLLYFLLTKQEKKNEKDSDFLGNSMITGALWPLGLLYGLAFSLGWLRGVVQNWIYSCKHVWVLDADVIAATDDFAFKCTKCGLKETLTQRKPNV